MEQVLCAGASLLPYVKINRPQCTARSSVRKKLGTLHHSRSLRTCPDKPAHSRLRHYMLDCRKSNVVLLCLDPSTEVQMHADQSDEITVEAKHTSHSFLFLTFPVDLSRCSNRCIEKEPCTSWEPATSDSGKSSRPATTWSVCSFTCNPLNISFSSIHDPVEPFIDHTWPNQIIPLRELKVLGNWNALGYTQLLGRHLGFQAKLIFGSTTKSRKL